MHPEERRNRSAPTPIAISKWQENPWNPFSVSRQAGISLQFTPNGILFAFARISSSWRVSNTHSCRNLPLPQQEGTSARILTVFFGHKLLLDLFWVQNACFSSVNKKDKFGQTKQLCLLKDPENWLRIILAKISAFREPALRLWIPIPQSGSMRVSSGIRSSRRQTVMTMLLDI